MYGNQEPTILFVNGDCLVKECSWGVQHKSIPDVHLHVLGVYPVCVALVYVFLYKPAGSFSFS